MPRRVTNGGRHHPTWGSHHLALADSLEGMIMWLPQREELPDHSGLPDLPKGCYGHPVVILSPHASLPAHHVVVLIVTSLGETDVGDKFPYDIELRRAHLPIHPARNRDTKIQLRLQNGAQLRKKSYAKTHQQRTIPLSFLQPYDRNDVTARYVLTSDSYKKLARRAGFVLDAAAPSRDTDTTDLSAETLALVSGSTRDERLNLEPTTYGTMPVSRLPPSAALLPPSPPSSWYCNALIDHHHRTTIQPARQQILPPGQPVQPSQPLLPRYHSRPPVHDTHTRSRESGGGEAGCLAELTVNGVLLVLMALGLLWVWVDCVVGSSGCWAAS